MMAEVTLKTPEAIHTQIAQELGLDSAHVRSAVELLDDKKTIPFIARYRKELTGAMTEIHLRQVAERLQYLRNLEERKMQVGQSIDEQGKLTDDLALLIAQATILQQVEDLYQPYKKRKKTRADMARERGLEEASKLLTTLASRDDAQFQAWIDPEKEVHSLDDLFQGARDILAEEMASHLTVKERMRKWVWEKGTIQSQQAEMFDQRGVYETYYDYQFPIKRLSHHQVLALNRGESEKVLQVHLHLEPAPIEEILKIAFPSASQAYMDQIREAVQDGYQRLLFPSTEREIRNRLTDSAHERSIQVFTQNLRNLLLTPPLKKKTILGIDPGFRTGCKCALVDEQGIYRQTVTIFPHPPQKDEEGAFKILENLFQSRPFQIVAIGNGTASRETEETIARWIETYHHQEDVAYLLVSEAGASVYSASDAGIEEFPDLDITTRGAISIARRVQDPLAEYVKIPPESIGVGMYQHDLPGKELKASLDREVESVVNFVGVDLNSASSFLLAYISGLNRKSARAVQQHRHDHGPFPSRQALRQVKGVGPRAFEQAAGFCRVVESENPLDNTIIHPESYETALKILNHMGFTIEEFRQSREKARERAAQTDPSTLSQALAIHPITAEDILKALAAKSLDPRDAFPQPLLKKEVRSLDQLQNGMLMQGTIRNVVDFGLFVDIGVKVDGLVHRSQMGKFKGKDPLKVAKVGQIIEVEILKVDASRQRIQLKWVH